MESASPPSNTALSGLGPALPQIDMPHMQHGIQIMFRSCQLSSPYVHQSEVKFRRARAAVASISLNHCIICIAARHVIEDDRYDSIETIYDKKFWANWDLSIDERILEVKWGRIRQPPDEFACLRFDTSNDLWQFSRAFKEALSITQHAKTIIIKGMSNVHNSLYSRRLGSLNMSITGYTAVQCAALEKEYSERNSVQDDAEALLHEAGAFYCPPNVSTGDISVPPITFSLDGFNGLEFHPLVATFHSPAFTYFETP